jgi:hypothetical protein
MTHGTSITDPEAGYASDREGRGWRALGNGQMQPRHAQEREDGWEEETTMLRILAGRKRLA